jgi:flagellar protein FliO/FliZ
MQAVQFFFAFLAVLVLIIAAAWLVRRFAGNRLGTNTNRGRMPRLAVIDAAAVDGRRRLVLVRRDNVEHLLMIGGPTDIVVEANIVRAMPAREQLPQRAPAAPAEPPPRLAPLPEAANWGDNDDHGESPIPSMPPLPPMPELPSRPARPAFAEELRRPAPMAAERRIDPLAGFALEPLGRPEPRPEPPLRSEPPLRAEQRPEPPIRSETLRPETLRPESLRPETLRPETLRPETLRPETLRPEPPPRPEPLPPRAPARAEPMISRPPRPSEPPKPPLRAPVPERERAAAPPLPPSADQSLAEMAQRLEAALRRAPGEPASPPVAPEPPQQPPQRATAPRSEPPPPPAPTSSPASAFDSLEDEMASLLGRSKSSSS